MPLHAITRPISPRMAECELTCRDRTPIDVELARRQHRAYEKALAEVGCLLLPAPAAPEHPDAVFVEDTAIVLDEVAVATRPGASSRRGEVEGVVSVLERFRPIRRIEEPGTIDGGDVLRIGRTLFVGRSTRTNETGIDALGRIAGEQGYSVRAVDFRGCLHLKSAATRIGPDAILANPELVDPAVFEVSRVIEVDPAEPEAANALEIAGVLLLPAEHVRTGARLAAAGFEARAVSMTEVGKAEGGVTCCSLVFEG